MDKKTVLVPGSPKKMVLEKTTDEFIKLKSADGSASATIHLLNDGSITISMRRADSASATVTLISNHALNIKLN